MLRKPSAPCCLQGRPTARGRLPLASTHPARLWPARLCHRAAGRSVRHAWLNPRASAASSWAASRAAWHRGGCPPGLRARML